METLRDLAARLGTTPTRLLLRTVIVLLAASALYVMGPQLLDMIEDTPRLTTVSWWWVPVVVAAWIGGVIALWILLSVALPRVPLRDLAMVHLSANAVANCVPAGPAVAGAVAVRLFGRVGVDTKLSAAAVGATGFVTAATLIGLTPIAAVVAILLAELPPAFEAFAWVGVALSVLVALAVLAMLWGRTTMRLLVAASRLADRALLARLGSPLRLDLPSVLQRRAQLRSVLADHWQRGVAAAAGHWMLEVTALAAALAAVGTIPSPGLVFLAYAATVVLRLLPITPGGLGFVEAGLVGALTVAGISVSEAVLATLLYRVVTFWAPIPVGAAAYVVLRSRHPARNRSGPQSPSR